MLSLLKIGLKIRLKIGLANYYFGFVYCKCFAIRKIQLQKAWQTVRGGLADWLGVAAEPDGSGACLAPGNSS